MANGHVEIHDLFSSQHCDPKPTSDGDGMDDTEELRLMMAYAKRRRPQQELNSQTQDSPVALNGSRDANGTAPSQTPAKTETEVTEVKTKKKKGKKGWKRLASILKCVKPQTEDKEPQRTPQPESDYRCISPSDDRQTTDEVEESDNLGEAVSRLTEIADEIPFTPPEWETDSPDSKPEPEVEKIIGLLLRESGDRLNERELKNANIAAELFWNYSFFRSLINALLMRMGLRSSDPEALGPQASPKTQIAVACEVTSRLSAVDTLPTNRLLSHGARYLQDYFSTWAQQQGGYEAAFEGDKDEVD